MNGNHWGHFPGGKFMRTLLLLCFALALLLQSGQNASAMISPMAGLTTKELIDLAWTFDSGSRGDKGAALARCRALPADRLVLLRGDALGNYNRNRQQLDRLSKQIARQSQTTAEALYTASADLYDVAGLRKNLVRQVRHLDSSTANLARRLDRWFAPGQTAGRATGFARDFIGATKDAAEIVAASNEIVDSTTSWFKTSTASVENFHGQVKSLTELVVQQRHVTESMKTYSGRYAFFEICVRFGKLERPEDIDAAEAKFRLGTGNNADQTFVISSEDFARARDAVRRSFDSSCYVDCECVASIIEGEQPEYVRASFDFFARAPMRTEIGMVSCTDLTGESGFARNVAGQHSAPSYSGFLARLRHLSTTMVDQCPNLVWMDSFGKPGYSCWSN